jgi:glutathione S-transferase
MQLYFAQASPFVRKARVVALELGIADRIDLVEVSTTAVAPDPALATANPLRKIPALVLDDGTVLFDSIVICEYLDATYGNNRLVPAAGPGRWLEKRTEAAAHGVMDAAVLIRYEQALRPPDKQWQDWIDGQVAKVTGGLDVLDQAAAGFDEAPTIGQIAAACALGYLDFRFGDLAWRDGRAALANWYARFAERPSMMASRPD